MNPSLPYTPTESEGAHATWKAACGHHSLAAASGLTLEAIRQIEAHHHGHHGWMNPRLMHGIASKLGLSLHVRTDLGNKLDCLLGERPAVMLIQYLGPWMKPGVDTRKRAKYTHWIARHPEGYILDTQINPQEWMPVDDWLIEHQAVLGRKTSTTGWQFTWMMEIP